ncbi:COMM domain-containing protein [Heracleum sosnowskyi]|uniref:COMM domain-containing protein n=1 Tax=Heracleum sosnowskyi TaxID=360622 RepID=A0AAD8ISX1_9APIA|nr:COMM domain-containing protein [Heracleum sosnowskyi]
MQRLLTLLLQKFHSEWQEDIQKERGTLPRFKTMTWDMVSQEGELMEPLAVINLKLQSNAHTQTKETNVKFQLAKNTLNTMMQSMYCIRDQLSNTGETRHEPLHQQTDMV